MNRLLRRISLLMITLWLSWISISPTEAQELSNWMGRLPPDRSIAELAIPGTHDTGARFENKRGTIKCQSLSIPDQLKIGVRFLDIRCRHVGDKFLIHHSSVFQKLTFQDMLNSCESFLDQNPTECVIMSIKEEYTPESNTQSFEATFKSYLNENPKRWWLDEKIPTLGQAAGKIVLFRRFPSTSPPLGIAATPWPDNTNFSLAGTSARLVVQDHYRLPHVKEKLLAIKNQYLAAAHTDPNCLYVNFTSGYKPTWRGKSSIPAVQRVVEPWLMNYLRAGTNPVNGITLINFVNETECRLLISANK